MSSDVEVSYVILRNGGEYVIKWRGELCNIRVSFIFVINEKLCDIDTRYW